VATDNSSTILQYGRSSKYENIVFHILSLSNWLTLKWASLFSSSSQRHVAEGHRMTKTCIRKVVKSDLYGCEKI